ncbi:hypothetical protein PG995_003214 [Apiospora arundinis]
MKFFPSAIVLAGAAAVAVAVLEPIVERDTTIDEADLTAAACGSPICAGAIAQINVGCPLPCQSTPCTRFHCPNENIDVLQQGRFNMCPPDDEIFEQHHRGRITYLPWTLPKI